MSQSRAILHVWRPRVASNVTTLILQLPGGNHVPLDGWMTEPEHRARFVNYCSTKLKTGLESMAWIRLKIGADSADRAAV